MAHVTFAITPIGTAGAAEIRGLDCSQPFDADDLARVRAAFGDFPILAFRDQTLTPSQQARFSAQFGPLINEENAAFTHPADPNVLILTNELRADGSPIGVVDAGDYFHSDSSHKPEPVLATILYAVRNPQTGGQTDFANMTLLYAALPDDLRRAVDGRRAWHHVSKANNPRVAVSANRPGAAQYYALQARERSEILQPVVRTHPETGKRSLYVSPRFTLRIEGLDPAESESILSRIFALMEDERFIYRHTYRDRDLVMWDNRCLNHRATGGYALPDIRRMHRTTVHGDRPY
jgi:taurine dioxygenase